jgi:rare lipoprotein A (peptidoglycan hydrolase)
MRPRLAVREAALAGVALLAATISIAVTTRTHGSNHTTLTPEGSYVAPAGVLGPSAFGRRTACGGVLREGTEGVANPTLPCGTRIFIRYRGKTVVTHVVDRGPRAPRRQFDLTEALARRLGFEGVQQVSWSYARSG